MKKYIGPYSFLIIPLFLESGRIKDFKKYINRCHQSDECNWELGRVISNEAKNSKKRLCDFYRISASYSFLHQLFHPFVTDNPQDKLDDEYCVLRYKGVDGFDEPLEFEDPFGEKGPVTFGIFNHTNSFDALKLIFNLEAKVGLLVIPTSADIDVSQYSDFLYAFHTTSLKCITGKKNSEVKCINDFIRDWMSDFKGWYHQFNMDYAHHLTYVNISPETNDADCRLLTSSITKCYHHQYSYNMDVCRLEVYPKEVYIGIAPQGLTIMTKLPDNPTEEQVLYYRREHTEHYMLYMMCLLQRYVLIRIVADLSSMDKVAVIPVSWIKRKWQEGTNLLKRIFCTHNFLEVSHISMRAYLKQMREQTKIISITQIKNNFSSISDFPEYNLFYNICNEILGIKSLYDEIEKKMKRLDAYLIQAANENKERADWILSMILAFLTVFSATKDIMDLTEKVITKEVPTLYIIVATFAIIPIVLLFYTIIKTFRR